MEFRPWLICLFHLFEYSKHVFWWTKMSTYSINDLVKSKQRRKKATTNWVLCELKWSLLYSISVISFDWRRDIKVRTRKLCVKANISNEKKIDKNIIILGWKPVVIKYIIVHLLATLVIVVVVVEICWLRIAATCGLTATYLNLLFISTTITRKYIIQLISFGVRLWFLLPAFFLNPRKMEAFKQGHKQHFNDNYSDRLCTIVHKYFFFVLFVFVYNSVFVWKFIRIPQY